MTAHVALALSEVEGPRDSGSTEPALSTVEWAASLSVSAASRNAYIWLTRACVSSAKEFIKSSVLTP